MSRLGAALGRLQPISLAEVLLFAGLQTRLDRKYIVAADAIAGVLDRLAPTLRRLEIDGRSDFRYETTYFDTPELDSYRGGAYGRRRRFKVRTRSYLDSGECMLEVKTAAGRGHTVKERTAHPIQHRHQIPAGSAKFLVAQGLPPDLPARLRATLTTSYRRSTLTERSGARLTLDTGLVCRAAGGSAGIGDLVLVETKSPGAATAVDRLLWSAGYRPVPVSKYGTGLAAIDGALPANKWHRTLRSYFEPVGARDPGPIATTA